MLVRISLILESVLIFSEAKGLNVPLKLASKPVWFKPVSNHFMEVVHISRFPNCVIWSLIHKLMGIYIEDFILG